MEYQQFTTKVRETAFAWPHVVPSSSFETLQPAPNNNSSNPTNNSFSNNNTNHQPLQKSPSSGSFSFGNHNNNNHCNTMPSLPSTHNKNNNYANASITNSKTNSSNNIHHRVSSSSSSTASDNISEKVFLPNGVVDLNTLEEYLNCPTPPSAQSSRRSSFSSSSAPETPSYPHTNNTHSSDIDVDSLFGMLQHSTTLNTGANNNDHNGTGAGIFHSFSIPSSPSMDTTAGGQQTLSSPFDSNVSSASTSPISTPMIGTGGGSTASTPGNSGAPTPHQSHQHNSHSLHHHHYQPPYHPQPQPHSSFSLSPLSSGGFIYNFPSSPSQSHSQTHQYPQQPFCTGTSTSRSTMLKMAPVSPAIASRQEKLEKYKQKRSKRMWNRSVDQSRRERAQSRPRDEHGHFITNSTCTSPPATDSDLASTPSSSCSSSSSSGTCTPTANGHVVPHVILSDLNQVKTQLEMTKRESFELKETLNLVLAELMRLRRKAEEASANQEQMQKELQEQQRVNKALAEENKLLWSTVPSKEIFSTVLGTRNNDYIDAFREKIDLSQIGLNWTDSPHLEAARAEEFEWEKRFDEMTFIAGAVPQHQHQHQHQHQSSHNHQSL